MHRILAVTVVCLTLVSCDANVLPPPPANPPPIVPPVPVPALPPVESILPHGVSVDDWEEFSDPVFGFKVKFPDKPHIDLPDSPSPTYTGGKDKVTCTVQIVTEGPQGLDVELQRLKNAIGHFGPAPVEKPVTLAGRPSVEIEAEIPANARYKRPPPVTVARFLKTDSAVIMVKIFGRPEVVTKELQTKFFDSFQLTK